ncbi:MULTISPECIES: hypothetical protein [Cyanophyceae]|uniref:hypothetical protein n=1 Tax=Cyanophyceae TaxID=3028117 RepID=UPI001685D0A9|nr:MULTISPECIES: hypothetical protein [Cyanophyceae]MBD2029499.1 hypothetical protein [Phormidium sp. FACHB-322]
MVRQLPKWLKRAFKVRVLADTAFGGVDFFHGICKLSYRRLREYAMTANSAMDGSFFNCTNRGNVSVYRG